MSFLVMNDAADVSCCRAMPLPVLGSVSEAEAIGLGKLLEKHARKQTGTLFNGIDYAADDEDNIIGQLKKVFVHRTGELTSPGLWSCGLTSQLQHVWVAYCCNNSYNLNGQAGKFVDHFAGKLAIAGISTVMH